ncbi:uncharacterized protein [Watersipora subatra]|uniref:uncharacterized protein n=1 Tax=Watersipora subatra TaxID=2589382 RepID=UPI00355C5C08
MGDPPPDNHDEPDSRQPKGYKKLEVEDHGTNPHCKYNSVKGEKRLSGCQGFVTFDTFTLTRCCSCGNYNSPGEEVHYKRKCRWKKVTDEVSGKVYLIRKCYCQEPSAQ